MADFMETEDKRSVIKEKLRQQFDGKIVRKDLTKKIKEGANVPVSTFRRQSARQRCRRL